MEREKMIEEMREIAEVLSAGWCRKGKCTGNKCAVDDCDIMTQAREIYDAGYRKIPDGAVVLTKTQFDNIPKITQKYGEEKSKETAREILHEVKAFLDMQTKTVNGLSEPENKSRYAIPENCRDCYNGSQENRIAELKRIAERCGLEVEE